MSRISINYTTKTEPSLFQLVKTSQTAPAVQIPENNTLERTPDADKVEIEKKKSDILPVALALSAIAASVEFFVFKGRHLKNIFNKSATAKPEKPVEPPKVPHEPPKTAPEAPKTTPEPVSEIKVPEKPQNKANSSKVTENEAAQMLKAEENAAKEAENRLLESNRRNSEWVANQHNIKEKEYSKWWNDAIKKQEAEKIIVKNTEKGSEFWQNGRKISETVKEKFETITTYFDKAGKTTKIESTGAMHRNLEIYDPKTGVQKEKFLVWFGKLNVSRNNEEIFLQIPHVRLENFDEAVKLARKYENVQKNELESIYREILNGNPKKISELEFNVIESHLDLHTKTIPKTSKATQIKEHHYLNGINSKYRDAADGIIENEQKAQKLLADMQKIDREIAELPPLEKDCVFYRGINSKFIPQITDGKVGDVVIPDKAYAYAGFERTLAQSFGDGTILVIKTPKGARVSRNMEHNGEAVFPRNSEYRILSKGKTPDGDWRIELEYILPNAK